MPVNYRSVIGYVSFIAAFSGPVSAQQVHKCVKGAETVYQSAPCEAGQATAKTWERGTYQPPSNAERWRIYRTHQATRQRDVQLRAGNSGGGGGVGTSVGSGIGRCEAAKRTRDASLDATRPRQGHSIESRRSWDSYVEAACK